MEFPTKDGDPVLERVYRNILGDAARARAIAKGFSDDIAAGRNIEARSVVGLFESLWSIRDRWDGYRDTPGIGPYAKARWDADPGLDVVAAFGTVKTAITSFLVWIDANIGKSANGFIEEREIEADGSLTWKVYTAAQLGPMKTRLDTLIATIAL